MLGKQDRLTCFLLSVTGISGSLMLMEIPAIIRLPIDSVLQLLKRFLGVSIIESGKLRLDLEPVDLVLW